MPREHSQKRRLFPMRIWKSAAFAELTDRQKLLYLGLYSTADDEGRNRATPTAIQVSTLSSIFIEVSREEISADLAAVAKHMPVILYSVGDDWYIQMTDWCQPERHYLPSFYPPPEGWQPPPRLPRTNRQRATANGHLASFTDYRERIAASTRDLGTTSVEEWERLEPLG